VQCVDKMQRCFGDGDIRVGAALHNMAGLYMSMDPPDLNKAEGFFASPRCKPPDLLLCQLT